MKSLGRYIVLWLTCTLVFAALMLLAYALPDSLLEENVRASGEQLEVEGIYPHLFPNDENSQLDNWTESYVLSMASHRGDTPFTSAFLNPYYDNELAGTSERAGRVGSVCDGLGQDANRSYGRYWQGYLALIRPLLAIFTLHQIYWILLVLLVGLLGLALWGIGRHVGIFPALALVVSLLAVQIWVISFSTKFYFSFAVALAAVTLVMSRVETHESAQLFVFSAHAGHAVHSAPEQVYTSPKMRSLFFLFGAVTVFLDYMSTPLVALGLPLAALICARRQELQQRSVREVLLATLRLIGVWLLGWLLLGLTNWMIYIAVSPDTAEALSTVVVRFGNWAGHNRFEELSYTRWSGLLSGLKLVAGQIISGIAPVASRFGLVLEDQKINKAAALLILFALMYLPVLLSFKNRNQGAVLSCALVASLTFIWWIVISTSAAEHMWAVYRSISLSYFASLCGWWLLVDGWRKKPSEHAA